MRVVGFYIVMSLILSFLSIKTIGQEPVVRLIEASVKITDERGKKVKDATLVLYDGEKEIQRIENVDPKLDLDLERGRFYTIEVRHKDFAPKRVGFQTALEYQVAHDLEYSFDLELQSKEKFTSEELASGKIDYPVTVIIYDPIQGKFDSKTIYAESTIDVMYDLMMRYNYKHNKQ